jgi:hypothetical protein
LFCFSETFLREGLYCSHSVGYNFGAVAVIAALAFDCQWRGVVTPLTEASTAQNAWF